MKLKISSALIIILLLFSNIAYSQSVLSKFNELNTILDQSGCINEFTINETGQVKIKDDSAGVWSVHFTNIEKSDSLWIDGLFHLVLCLKENKKMVYKTNHKTVKNESRLRIAFDDPEKGRKAVAKLHEAIQIGQPRTKGY